MRVNSFSTPGLASFALALFPLIFLPLYIPNLRLTYFAPHILLMCSSHSLMKALWQALLCGLVIDLLSSHTLFGLTALNYCLTTALLHRQTRNLFQDKFSTLPAMSFFFSMLSTGLHAFLLGFLGTGIFFTWHWVLTDLFFMPLLDAAYAFIWFSLPFQLTGKAYKLIRNRIKALKR